MSSVIKSDHSVIGGTLIFIGGILALIFPIFPLTLSLLLRDIIGELFEEVGGWILGVGLSGVPYLATSMLFFIMIGAIVTIICGALAIYTYTWVKRGKVKDGGLVAITVGVIMVVTLHWIPGIITIIGGALCFMSKPRALEARARLGNIKIDQSALNIVYHSVTGQIHIDGREIGEKGKKLHKELKKLKKGDMKEFSCEDNIGQDYYGIAKVKEIKLDEEHVGDEILYKFLIELQP